MTSERLLRLYPRAWRERYGEEFLDLIGSEPLGTRLTLDIVAGALDARLTRQSALVTDERAAGTKGGNAVLKSLQASCDRNARGTARDGAIGIVVMLGAMAIFMTAGSVAAGAGYATTAEFLNLFGLSGAFFVGLPFMTTPHRSWRFKAFTIAAPLTIIGVATLVSILT